jgi:hypothetical protein
LLDPWPQRNCWWTHCRCQAQLLWKSLLQTHPLSFHHDPSCGCSLPGQSWTACDTAVSLEGGGITSISWSC